MQNDFCLGGALAVPGGDRSIPAVNRVFSLDMFDEVLATQTWHPRLDLKPVNLIIRKVYDPEIDSYSGLVKNDRKTESGLHCYLQG